MRIVSFLLLCGLAAPCFAQRGAIDEYYDDPNVQGVANLSTRTDANIVSILPEARSQRFAMYAEAKGRLALLRADIEKLRLNKLVGNTAGGAGTTALVSKVAVPGVLGFASEYGSILQNNSGNATTLRGNLLGISRMALGAEQFPYCAEINQKSCQPASRWLRRFSGDISFENLNGAATTTGTAATSTANVPVSQLFGNDFRMASWGARFDLTSNDPSDPSYAAKWSKQIGALTASPAPGSLTAAVSQLIGQNSTLRPLYVAWSNEAVAALKGASTSEFKQKLEAQLDILLDRMTAADPEFLARLSAVRIAFLSYATVRDNLLRDIQSNQLSLEYTNQHPQNQPTTSNIRLIYSDQPAKSPTLITANIAFTWYNATPNGVNTGRFRDFQLAGQLDRRLGEIPNLGNAVATFAGYYQWMKEDALIIIGPGNVAPGSGIVLPGTAAKLLGTKGNIGILQGKLSIPVNSIVKIPISVTWSNRTELINEKDIRGQVGMTLDLDSIFKK